ncbi:MAG: hypothetical protein LBF22_12000, partial [Deltaproteobacteria bacterium]|nr:hypothetical protein [Deltaproteobacteria bacterium]
NTDSSCLFTLELNLHSGKLPYPPPNAGILFYQKTTLDHLPTPPQKSKPDSPTDSPTDLSDNLSGNLSNNLTGTLTTLLEKDRLSFPVTYGGRKGSLIYFYSSPPPSLFFNSPCIYYEPSPHNFLKNFSFEKGSLNPYPLSLQGHDFFLDPTKGWLISFGENQTQKPPTSPWLDLNKDSLPEGLIFVDALDFPRVILELLKRFPKDEKTLVSFDNPDLLLKTSQMLTLEKCSFFYPHLEAPPELLRSSLRARAEELREKKQQELDSLQSENLSLTDTLNDLTKDLNTLRGLKSLEKNLETLKEEITVKESHWATIEYTYGTALSAWEKLQFSVKKSLLELLPAFISQRHKEKNKEETLEKQTTLNSAEKAMAIARQEREDFIREARALKEALAEAKNYAVNLSPLETIEERHSALQKEIQKNKAQSADILRLLNKPLSSQVDFASLTQNIFLCLESIKSEELPPFDNLICVNPPLRDHALREDTLKNVFLAQKRLLLLTDFTPLFWETPAPTDTAGVPAWHTFNGKVIQDSLLPPNPAQASLTISEPKLPVLTFLAPVDDASFSLRALGETGPSNPLSALAAAKLASKYLESAPQDFWETHVDSIIGSDFQFNFYTTTTKTLPQVLIVTPSPSQTRLIQAILRDLGKSHLSLVISEPGDLENFPPANLVILDLALAPPHSSHPWARKELGFKALERVYTYAREACILLGEEKILHSFPLDSPLGEIKKHLSPFKVYADLKRGIGVKEIPFREAVEQVKHQIFLIVPQIEPTWWPRIAPQIIGALRRKIKVTLVASLPVSSNRDYPGQVIRDLKNFGALVILSQGLEGFLALLDNEFLAWGDIYTGSPNFRPLSAITLPQTIQEINHILQIPLIQQKLAPGAFRNCPVCGWPYVLINQARLRGFGDLNSLKLGCLNESCANHKRPRPLHERWPFINTPLCTVDNTTPYEIITRGKKDFWACPNHPAEVCPRYRVIAGDRP